MKDSDRWREGMQDIETERKWEGEMKQCMEDQGEKGTKEERGRKKRSNRMRGRQRTRQMERGREGGERDIKKEERGRKS